MSSDVIYQKKHTLFYSKACSYEWLMVFHLFFSFQIFVFNAVMKITKMTKLYPKICLYTKIINNLYTGFPIKIWFDCFYKHPCLVNLSCFPVLSNNFIFCGRLKPVIAFMTACIPLKTWISIPLVCLCTLREKSYFYKVWQHPDDHIWQICFNYK